MTSLILGLGASAGLLRLLQAADASRRIRWLLAGLFTLLGALMGARLGFALLFHEYFRSAGIEIINPGLGGLYWPGAAAGAILFAWLGCSLLRLPRRIGLDRLSRLLLPLGIAAWLAAWQFGVAYGTTLPSGTWWGTMALDEGGNTALRAPVQPAAILSLMVLILLMERVVRKNPVPGLTAGTIGIVFFIHTFVFSFMRADPTRVFAGWRWDTWTALIFISASVVFLLVILRLNKTTKLE